MVLPIKIVADMLVGGMRREREKQASSDPGYKFSTHHRSDNIAEVIPFQESQLDVPVQSLKQIRYDA